MFPIIWGVRVACSPLLAASGRAGEFTQPLPQILWGKRYTGLSKKPCCQVRLPRITHKMLCSALHPKTARWLGLEIELLGLVADSEHNIVSSLSATNPNSSISMPNDGATFQPAIPGTWQECFCTTLYSNSTKDEE